MKQVFLITNLDGSTQRIESSRTLITVGRRRKSDIILKGTKISRDHGFFKVNGKHLDYYDTSSNGSFINGELVRNAPRNLSGGDMVEFWGESITVLSKVVADIKTPPGGIVARHGKSKGGGTKGGKPGLVMPDPATSVYRNLYRNFKLRSLYIFILYSILPLWIAGLVVHVISTVQAARLARLGRAVVVGQRLLRLLWIWAAVSLVLGLFLLTRNFPEFVVSRYIMEFMTGLF